MILYLRNENNETVVDMEIFTNSDDITDVICTVMIKPYTEILLKDKYTNKEKVANDFDKISEIRSWFWESYMLGKNQPVDPGSVINAIKKYLEPFRLEYSLYYVTD